MKKSKKIILCLLFVSYITLSLGIFSVNVQGALDTTPGFGEPPVIDGIIDHSENEWEGANKTIDFDFLNTSSYNSELWVMQSDSNLYIAIQFNLLHVDTEFIGIKISNSTSNSTESYKDARIVQFTNLSLGEYNYKDYKINNSVFTEDITQDGEGAAVNDGNDICYEFMIPLESEDPDDVSLEYGESYTFNITYGESNSYPSSMKHFSVVVINIQEPKTPEIDVLELSIHILAIIVFSATGAFIFIYILKIFSVKKKIKRIVRQNA
ncbi:MAG: hypothetical protein ACFFAS_14720 [Promethearchaeota archaeon]